MGKQTTYLQTPPNLHISTCTLFTRPNVQTTTHVRFAPKLSEIALLEGRECALLRVLEFLNL